MSISMCACHLVMFNLLARVHMPYSGKLWRALNLANQSSEYIGEFKFGDCEPFRMEQLCMK